MKIKDKLNIFQQSKHNYGEMVELMAFEDSTLKFGIFNCDSGNIADKAFADKFKVWDLYDNNCITFCQKFQKSSI